jgi:hypothetical protein
VVISEKSDRPKVLLQISGPDRGLAASAHNDILGHAPADGSQLPFEVSHPRLPGVGADYAPDRPIIDFQIIGGKSMGLTLLGQQMAPGDLQLLILGVAGQLHHLHAVAQRPGNGVEDVGGGDEHDPGEIKGDLQVMIRKGIVLLGQDLKRARRVAAEIHAQFVDLIEHEHRVVGARLLQALDDPSRQCPDIGAAMAPDLGLIPHPAERDAHEFAAQAPGNGLPQRGLAHAGWPHKTEDGTVHVGLELAHRQEFDDPLLDLLQAEMVRIEGLLGLDDIEIVGGGDLPGQIKDPFQVIARYCVLRR